MQILKQLNKLNNSRLILYIFLLFVTLACEHIEQEASFIEAESPKQAEKFNKLELLAISNVQFTGIAVSKKGRIFVCFPRWSRNIPFSVAEIVDEKFIPFPTRSINDNDNIESFNSIQSVYIDSNDDLWVLETNNPLFQGVKAPGPVLYQYDLKTNKRKNTFMFSPAVYHIMSYFNDVRIDCRRKFAYITDSGLGAIIVLNLRTGKAKRVLESTKYVESETNCLKMKSITWNNSVDVDGIAISPDRDYIYFSALTGHSLYRVPTKILRDFENSDEQISKAVEKIAHIPATDGMLMDPFGNIYMGGLESDSINLLSNDCKSIRYFSHPEISWADSFGRDGKGNIYFTTSQIHIPSEAKTHYKIIRFNPYQIRWLYRPVDKFYRYPKKNR